VPHGATRIKGKLAALGPADGALDPGPAARPGAVIACCAGAVNQTAVGDIGVAVRYETSGKLE
jgi:hypothetical protein